MHPNAELLRRFYTAFAARDAETMAACYAPDVTFTDPVFDLRGPDVARMWRTLCRRGRDLEIAFSGIEADDAAGRAHWEARYTFQGGRKVHNVIDAAFTFREGLVVRHVDTFDFWRWSRQALGPAGLLLGWSPLLRRKVQAEALRGLDPT